MGDMAFRDDISRGSAEPGPSSGYAAAQSAVNGDRVLLCWAPMTLKANQPTNKNGGNVGEERSQSS